jgi:hypothetical protein
MATRIYLKNGLGKPDLSDFGGVTGEILVDLQNYQIWTLSADGQSVEQLGSDISSETIDWSQLDNVPTEFNPADHIHGYDEVTDDGTAGGKTLETEIADILAHLNTIDSELGSLSGNLTFAGTVQMSTQTITSVTDAGADVGFSVGAIPADPPAGSDNLYFVCENGGTFDGGTYTGGDWLVSEGQGKGWTGIHFDSSVTTNWDEIAGKPTEFPPEAHTHEIDDVNGLQDALDNLSADGHTHVIDDVDGLQDALDGKASIIAINCGLY